jgi:hypothetical protein
MQLHADWAITLGCGGVCPYVPTVVEDWQIPDPARVRLFVLTLARRNAQECLREGRCADLV